MSAKRRKLVPDIRKSYPKALQSERSSSHWLVFLGLASIVIITLLVYVPAIRAGFIWDDDAYVSENPLLRNLSGLGKIWSLRLITKRDGHRYLTSYTPQYYPLVFSTFWLESHLWEQSNPSGFHAVNVLLHIANALLIWLICRRLGFEWAYLAALIFALHPVEVESVAWITERKNVLSGLFYLLAMLAYLRFDESRRKAFYFTALACFILALLSKTVTCTLPVILLLLLWLRHRRVSWSDLLRLIPFFAAGAFLGMFTAYLERHQVGAVGVEWQIAFWQRWVIAGRAVFFYASKLLCPIRLTFIYPRWNPGEFPVLGLLWPAAAIALAAALWYWRKSIGRAPLVAWAGFIITLFPALGFVDVYPFRYSFVADHFQYLASIFSIALFIGLAHGLYKRIYPQGFKFLVFPGVRIILTSVVLLLLGYLSYAQAAMYEDLEILWQKTIRNNPGAWMAWNNLGTVYNEQGRYDWAIRNFGRAIELNPRHAEAYNNRGAAYHSKGDYDQAIRDLTKAIDLNPSYARAYHNRGIVYGKQGRYDLAIRDSTKAIDLNPSYVEAYNSRGIRYGQKGESELAIRDFNQAIDLNPRSAKAYSNRGLAYRMQGEYKLAIGDFNKAIRLNPKLALAYSNRGLAYMRTGNYVRAALDFDQAIKLNPRDALAHRNMAQTLIKLGRAKEAVNYYSRALQLRADWPEVLNKLAWILATHEDAEIRNGAQAVRLAERACQLESYKRASSVDTLAAAYAEVGQFDQAVKTAEKAMQLARAAKSEKLAKDIRNRLELYKAKRPHRELFGP